MSDYERAVRFICWMTTTQRTEAIDHFYATLKDRFDRQAMVRKLEGEFRAVRNDKAA